MCMMLPKVETESPLCSCIESYITKSLPYNEDIKTTQAKKRKSRETKLLHYFSEFCSVCNIFKIENFHFFLFKMNNPFVPNYVF